LVGSPEFPSCCRWHCHCHQPLFLPLVVGLRLRRQTRHRSSPAATAGRIPRFEEDTNVDTGKPPISRRCPTPRRSADHLPDRRHPPTRLADKRAACTFRRGPRRRRTRSASRRNVSPASSRSATSIVDDAREIARSDSPAGPSSHDTRPDVEAVPEAAFSNERQGGASPCRITTPRTTCHPLRSDPSVDGHAQRRQRREDGRPFVKERRRHHRHRRSLRDSRITTPPICRSPTGMANTWPVNDHHFASVRSGTTPRSSLSAARDERRRPAGRRSTTPIRRHAPPSTGPQRGGLQLGRLHRRFRRSRGALNWEKGAPRRGPR